MEILYGLHPVEEALRAGVRRFDHVCVAKERHDARLQKVIDACRDAGVRLRFEPREQSDAAGADRRASRDSRGGPLEVGARSGRPARAAA